VASGCSAQTFTGGDKEWGEKQKKAPAHFVLLEDYCNFAAKTTQ